MQLKYKVILITLTFGVPAFFLGPVIWPTSLYLGRPSIALLPSFKFLYLLESLLFGLGVSFMIFGWTLVKHISSKTAGVSLYLAISWLLISWWPHDNFHLYVGGGIRNQMFLEYIFHIPTMLAILVIIKSLLENLLEGKLFINHHKKE